MQRHHSPFLIQRPDRSLHPAPIQAPAPCLTRHRTQRPYLNHARFEADLMEAEMVDPKQPNPDPHPGPLPPDPEPIPQQDPPDPDLDPEPVPGPDQAPAEFPVREPGREDLPEVM